MEFKRSFKDELIYQYKTGGAHIRIIFINTAVFLFMGILLMIQTLSNGALGDLYGTLRAIFTLNTDAELFITHPWGLFTYFFSHFSFIHFLLNMLFFYSAGQLYTQFFSGRSLWHLYILGGIGGGLFELIAHQLFQLNNTNIIGASGSVIAVFIALATYKPQLKLNLFGMFPMPFFVLALILIVSNLVSLGSNDLVAHFAHLGGAFVGYIAVQNLNTKKNIIYKSEQVFQFFKRLFQPKSQLTVKKGSRVPKTDEEYNLEKKKRQEKVDQILDKISKSGYESLTKSEKEFLFSQSKNG